MNRAGRLLLTTILVLIWGGVVDSSAYYDPKAGKWLSRDPIQEKGGVNVTSFCRNDPVNNVDPLGLVPLGEYIDNFGRMKGYSGIIQFPASLARRLSPLRDRTDMMKAVDWAFRSIMVEGKVFSSVGAGQTLLDAILSVPDSVSVYQTGYTVVSGLSPFPKTAGEMRLFWRKQVLSHALGSIQGTVYTTARTHALLPVSEEALVHRKLDYYESVLSELKRQQEQHEFCLRHIERVWRGKLLWDEEIDRDGNVLYHRKDFRWIRKQYPWYTRWATIRESYKENIGGKEMSIGDIRDWLKERQDFWRGGVDEITRMMEIEEAWLRKQKEQQ